MPHLVEFEELHINGKNTFNSNKCVEKVKDQQNDYINYTWANPEIQKNSSRVIQENNFNLNQEEDTLASYEDVIDEPIFGPCLVFGGQTAQWTGPDAQNAGIVALESRLNFETKAGKRVLATFELFNAGTCAIYYEWNVNCSKIRLNIN